VAIKFSALKGAVPYEPSHIMFNWIGQDGVPKGTTKNTYQMELLPHISQEYGRCWCTCFYIAIV